MKWSLDAIAAATSGRTSGAAAVTSVTTDSRNVRPGALFVALRGEHHDGHEFAAQAVAAGAEAVLAEHGRLPPGVSGVEVADTRRALGDLAVAARGEIFAPVVAITGSTGKTTTKDLAVAALGPGAHGAPLSFNNEVGVPLTLLSVPADATVVVVEVGSRGVGQIRSLSGMIRPDVAVITNIGPAHLETMGDVATVRRAKWELVEALTPEGVAVLPSDMDPPGPVAGRVVRFGEGPLADVSIVGLVLDDRGRAACTVLHEGEAVDLTLPFPGKHQAHNAAAALAIAIALGRPLGPAARRLGSATLSPWRMEIGEAAVGGGSVTVVNDAYNANPVSMASALETVAAMPGRRVAVLGRMHELGADEPMLHAEIGSLASRLGYAAVVAVGDDPGIADGAGPIAVAVPDVEGAVAVLRRILRSGDVVLVKASRAAGLEAVAAALVAGEAA